MKHKPMRSIQPCRYLSSSVDVPEGFRDDPVGWLAAEAGRHGLTTLLAHADDGVIWGKLEGGKLLLSSKAFPDVSPPLRSLTLQQARLFGPQAELMVWKDGDNAWHARLLSDEEGEPKGWCFDEAQLQWGDHLEEERDGFSLVREGQLGMPHAVPIPAEQIPFGSPSNPNPLRLGVRHYLERDDDGELVIIQGRLTRLWAEGRKEAANE
jgi:CRISPR-associated protein (TIGR03984 family)